MSIVFLVSVKPGLVGKQDLSRQLGTWPTREMTPRGLAQWAYFGHCAYCHGTFNNEAFVNDPQDYKTARANAFFLGASVVTIDIDSKDFAEEPHLEHQAEYLELAQMEGLLGNEFIRRHCFLITPSSGNRLPDKPNFHLHFKLNTVITSPEDYREIALALAAQIDVPTDQQTCKAAQLTAGTLFKDPARHEKGYAWEDLYVNEEAEEVDPAALPRVVIGHHVLQDAIDWAERRAQRARNYEDTESGNARVERHLAQPMEQRETVVLECLSFVLPTCSNTTTYDQWMQIWMSARHGAPTDKVRDYIVSHPGVFWSDGDVGRRKFYATWEHHEPRPDGKAYTVASLIYLALRAGWLTHTGYEIDGFLSEKIDVAHISDWLDAEPTVPERLALQSQTGSGKTETLIKLWSRLGAPKTVVFVPTIKLAVELARKLTKAGLPTTLYIETATGQRLDRQQLVDADVLVTTLQTFAMKAYRGTEIMHEYGLVYVEESDQLLGQFAKGGGGALYASSHVNEPQARRGFAVLRDAMENSGVVWFVDATMTKVTYKLIETLTTRPFLYVLNTRLRTKQTVRFVDSTGEAYQLILTGLVKGKRVVVACDKKERAKEVIDTLQAVGALDGKRWLLLTGETDHQTAAHAFMEDVEGQAAQYDLLAYNSVMGSGVSITQTTPDVLVQFCEYLSPRSNLQILNRYRSQERVYCYYADTESLYRRSAEEIYERAGHRADLESRTVFVPLVERDSLTRLRAVLATISVADEDMQKRSPRQFYQALLHADGRSILSVEEDPLDQAVEHTIEGVRRANKEQRKEVLAHWKEVPPVDAEHPAAPDMTDFQVACGRMHARIKDMLNGIIPDEVDPQYIADVCVHFDEKEFFLAALAHQERAISRAEQYLADRSKAITAIANYGTMLAVVLIVRRMFERLDGALTDTQVSERTPLFLKEMALHHEHYDTMFERGQYKYGAMVEKYGDDPPKLALAFSKVILARAGLTVEVKSRRHAANGAQFENTYHIKYVDEAEDLLTWKFRQKEGELPITLNAAWVGDAFEHEVERNTAANAAVETLTDKARTRLQKLLAEDFEQSRYADLVLTAQDPTGEF